MALTPVRQGQTWPPATWNFRNPDSSIVLLPAGTTFVLYIYNPKTNITTTGAGTWSPTNLSGGIATYAWDASDSAIPGDYQLITQFTLPAGAGVGYTLPTPWEVQPIFREQ